MYQGRRIAVVVPAHNEEQFVGGVIETIPPLVDLIVVVDDCSSDETSTIARRLEGDRVVVLQTPRTLGVGGATVLGYRRALEREAEIVAKMDGDGQMDPRYLPDLLDALVRGGYQYAKGNRFLIGEALDVMPRHRLLGNILLTFLTKLASGYWHVYDPLNGFTAITADALRAMDLNRVNAGYFFESDMLFQLNVRGARVRDVAVSARYGSEESGINPFRVGVTFPVLLAFMFWRRVYQRYVLRDFSPIALFLFVGIGFLLWGMGFGAYVWLRSSASGVPATTGTVMLAVLPLILGVQLVLQALVLDIHESPR